MVKIDITQTHDIDCAYQQIDFSNIRVKYHDPALNTPVYYSYKPYTVAHVDVNRNRIVQAFGNQSVWIAAYPCPGSASPNYNYFPSMNGVSIWQFDDNYNRRGIDGDVDLTGITYNGYHGNNQSKHETPVIKQGQ